MKKIICLLLVVSVILGLCACSFKEEKSVVVKMLEAFSDDDMVEFRKYADEFFSDGDGDELYAEFSEELTKQGIDFVTELNGEKDTIYNSVLWFYIFTYFYEEDMETFNRDSSQAISMMEKYKDYFQYSEDENKYYFATAYFQFLHNPEELQSRFFDALCLYYLTADNEDKSDIIYAVYMEALDLNKLYVNIEFFTKGNAIDVDVVLGDGQTTVDNISDIVNCSDNVLGSALGEDVIGFYNAEPIISERDKGDIFIFESPSYTIAYYGCPVYAYTIHDKLLGTVLYAKARDVADTEYYTYSNTD